MSVHTIKIADDFSRTPGGRYRTDSDNSAQRFREDFLVRALRHQPPYERIVIDLDNVLGYPSSFLEEAFGGLVRTEGFGLDELRSRIELQAKSPRFKINVVQIMNYLKEASRVH